MEPNKLDPKLKEAYDRVMGVSGTAKIQPNKPAPQPAAPLPLKPVSSFAPQQGQTTVLQAVPTTAAKPPAPTKPSNAKVKISDGAKVGDVTTSSSGLSFATILLYGAIVVFFVVYTIFWLRIFAIKLPFTLPF